MEKRLDVYLSETGLVESRNKAQAYIIAGEVFVNGKCVTKASKRVSPDVIVEIHKCRQHWVSRLGEKLEAALQRWNIVIAHKVCLDIGASTGGFTDVLLRHNAKKVYAVDVGHNQLHTSLRDNKRVVNWEGMDIRTIQKNNFLEPIECVVVDVSFISLENILPTVRELLIQGGICVALIKPQFEVGKRMTKKGIVQNDELRANVVLSIKQYVARFGFVDIDTMQSPIIGGKGNKEFLLFCKK